MKTMSLVFFVLFSMVSVGYSACEGDLNCNGVTDGTDLAIFAADFGTTGCGNCNDVIARIEELEDKIAELETLLQHFTRSGNDIYIEGANLHIRNGSGETNGDLNGLGNLIVGYNEERVDGEVDRSGSHNIVIGTRHNFSSYGGLVAGYSNTISGASASVSGGSSNTASGNKSSVSGGRNNIATGPYASVSGGHDNEAGNGNSWYASVSGGAYNMASGTSASVSGGRDNVAYGYATYASVCGGYKNSATGKYASVSGGNENTANGECASISGGHDNTASGLYSSVSGGRYNSAGGQYSFVGGGGGESENDGNIAFADYSSILGGWRNFAGDQNLLDHHLGEQSVVSAGSDNVASGDRSAVSGGYNNKATEAGASVSGGRLNSANAIGASVSGGDNTSVGDNFDWAAGDLYEAD